MCLFHTSKQLLNFLEWFILSFTKVRSHVFLLSKPGPVAAVLRVWSADVSYLLRGACLKRVPRSPPSCHEGPGSFWTLI